MFSVNSENELIYIDNKWNINKLSNDLPKITIFIARTETSIHPMSLYCSSLTGDVFVGMWIFDFIKEKGLSKLFIQPKRATYTNNTKHWRTSNLKKTENHNGDILVTGSFRPSSVVAIDRGGYHRFSYRGHPGHPEGNLYPFGICTDVFSHILISDINSGSIHMLDENGQFLSFLLINALESFGPYTLSYDVNTHNLWVGTGNNNIIYAFRYIDRQDIVTGKFVSQYLF